MRRRRLFAGSLGASALAVVGLVLSSAAGSAAHPTAPAKRSARATNRYSLVHGCYTLRSGGGVVDAADGPFRMQATTLGQYLIYGVHGDYLGADLSPAPAPGASTVWQVDGSSRRGFQLTDLGTGRGLPVAFAPATGCAGYPEGGVDASGKPFIGASPGGQVTGTIDAHTHVTAFEFLGGARGLAGVGFDQRGRVAALVVASRGYTAGGIAPGARRSALKRLARPVGAGVWIGRRRMPRGARFIYTVSGTRVVAVGIASAAVAGGRTGIGLRSVLRLP